MSLPDWNASDLAAAQPYLDAAIAQYGLDPALIYGQCSQESRFKPAAFALDRNGGSYGLMQLDYPTAQGLGYQGDPSGLYEPGLNAMLGCQLMAQLLAQFNGDASSALAAYNAGPNNLAGGAPYVALVLPRVAYFQALFNPPASGSGSSFDVSGGSGTLGAVATIAGALGLGYLFWRMLR